MSTPSKFILASLGLAELLVIVLANVAVILERKRLRKMAEEAERKR